MSLNRPIRALLAAVPVILAGLGAWSAHAASSSEPIKSGRGKLWAEEVKEAIRDRTPQRNGTVQEKESAPSSSASRGNGSGPSGNRDATGSTGGTPSGRGSNASSGDSPGRSDDRGGGAGGGNQTTQSDPQGSAGRGGDQGARGRDGRGADQDSRGGGARGGGDER